VVGVTHVRLALGILRNGHGAPRDMVHAANLTLVCKVNLSKRDQSRK
jgi:hypothetical protein